MPPVIEWKPTHEEKQTTNSKRTNIATKEDNTMSDEIKKLTIDEHFNTPPKGSVGS